jgi:nucleotide-binding universal stress UspA family protein
MEKEKHILLGVDGSPGSREAVNYIGSVFADNPDVYVDILHVLPPIPPLFSQPEGDMDELRRLQDGAAVFEKKCRNQAASIMEKAEHILAQHGMKEGNFRFLVRPRITELAREFLSAEKGGLYDAVVIGRRGMSRIEELFMGSVTSNVLQLAKKVTVCVVDGKITSKKLLVPIDGSPNSRRIVDSAAWLFSNSRFTEITLFYVLTSLFSRDLERKDSEVEEIEAPFRERMTGDAEVLLANAKKTMVGQGISEDSVKTHLETKSRRVAKSILKFANDRNCDSIMIGRRGVSRAKQMLLGSVSNKIIQQAQDKAVWVVS